MSVLCVLLFDGESEWDLSSVDYFFDGEIYFVADVVEGDLVVESDFAAFESVCVLDFPEADCLGWDLVLGFLEDYVGFGWHLSFVSLLIQFQRVFCIM